MSVWILVAVFVGALLLLVGTGCWNRHLSRRHMAGRPHLSGREFAQKYYPEHVEVSAKARDILQEYIKVDLSQMEPADQPVCDFHLGAIDGEETVDVIVALEEFFGIKIEDAEAEKMRTVDDIISRVISGVEDKQ